MIKYIVTVNGKKYEVEVEESGTVSVPVAATITEATKPENVKGQPAVKAKPAPAAGENVIKAPMPGTILDVKISQGQKVKKGDVLFILEAMKMENEIMAGEDGIVADIAVAKGTAVNTDDVLAVLE